METHKPVFIIGSFRGGTSLLFRLLSESNEFWSLYRESNFMWQSWHRDTRESADTLYLNENDFKESDRNYFDNHYHFSSYDNYFLGFLGRVKFLRHKLKYLFNLINTFNYIYKFIKLKLKNQQSYRFIDKTPPNSFRIQFLAKLYPDAKFIYLKRSAEANINSLMKAWNAPRRFQFKFREYLNERMGGGPKIKGYSGKVWKFAMPEGFKEFWRGHDLKEICEFQYHKTHEAINSSLKEINDDKYIEISFEDFLTNPDNKMEELCDFIDISYSKQMRKLVKEMPRVNSD
ncbi:MAG: sulfotransferase [Candidatus Caenarcaniphilales bacterium]|nr:sulfotransferase [Candidatus Caenarcaniphilales bacterium]